MEDLGIRCQVQVYAPLIIILNGYCIIVMLMDSRAVRYLKWRTGLVVCASLFLFSAHAADVVFVLSKNTLPYQQFVESVKQSLSHSDKDNVTSTVLMVEDYLDNPDGHKLVVAVGTSATRGIINSNTTQPVLSTLIPSAVYYDVLKDAPASTKKRVSGVFIDHPLNRYIRFIKEVYPRWKKIGLLSAENNTHANNEIRQFIKTKDTKIIHKTVSSSDEVIPTLNKLLKDSDVLLTLADPVVLNRSTAHGILLSAYHQKVPVVSYLKSYVKAGALSALYSSPEDLGKQVGEYIIEVASNNFIFIKHHQHPKYFSISVNERVAQSLGLGNIDAEKIKNTLYKMEGVK